MASAAIDKDHVVGLFKQTLLYVEGDAATPSTLRLHADTVSASQAASLAQQLQLEPLTKPPAHFDTSRTDVHVIISILSGKEHGLQVFENLVQPLLAALDIINVSIHTTTSAESVREVASARLATAALNQRPQTVILLSGDGGVVDLIDGLVSAAGDQAYTPPVIGLVPVGTGNALANSSGVLPSPCLGLVSLLNGSPSAVPLFKVDFDPPARAIHTTSANTARAHGAVVFSWGLHAALVADSDTPEFRKHGRDRFSAAAKQNLFPSDGSPPHDYTGRLSYKTSGSHSWQDVDRTQHAYVLATYCSQLEAGFRISPDSAPLDGRLRLVHFGPQPEGGKGVMDIMTGAFHGGRHVENEAVGYEDIDALRLVLDEEQDRWRRVCIDGTIYVAPQGGSVTVSRAVDVNVLQLLTMASI